MIALSWRDRIGDRSRSISRMGSSDIVPERFQKTLEMRSTAEPARSIASITLAKVGGAGLVAMASISARFSASAAS